MELTQERLKELLWFDKQKGVFCWVQDRPGKVKKWDLAGTKHKSGYVKIFIDGKNYQAHRLVWLYMTGFWPKKDIDHINNKRDDNRFENLREATRSQNQMNAKRIDKESGFVGVKKNKATNNWVAAYKGTKVECSSPIEAAKEYNRLVKVLGCPEFSYLNPL